MTIYVSRYAASDTDDYICFQITETEDSDCMFPYALVLTQMQLYVSSCTATDKGHRMLPDVLDEMGLADPVNGSHFDHEGWSGTEQLVPTDGTF